MSNFYLWCKALHIIAIISWMAGMLYLPRLFVYHAGCKKNSAESELLKVMEKKLLKIIVTPAMIASFIFGILLILNDYSYYLKSGWLHIKLFLVFILAAIHGYLSKTVQVFAQDMNQNSEKFYRILNEVPTLLMILIVILVVLKPF